MGGTGGGASYAGCIAGTTTVRNHVDLQINRNLMFTNWQCLRSRLLPPQDSPGVTPLMVKGGSGQSTTRRGEREGGDGEDGEDQEDREDQEDGKVHHGNFRNWLLAPTLPRFAHRRRGKLCGGRGEMAGATAVAVLVADETTAGNHVDL